MKRLKSICARGIAILLSAFLLSTTIIADYQKPVYATGVEESLYYGLRALIQTVMLSQGYSYSTTTDLDLSTKGLQNIIDSYKDSDSFEDAATLTGLFNWVAGKKIGDTLDDVTDHMGLVTYVKQYIQNQMAGKSSFTTTTDTLYNASLLKAELSVSTITTLLGGNYDISYSPDGTMYKYGILACSDWSSYSSTYAYAKVFCYAMYDFTSSTCPYIIVKNGDNLNCINKNTGSLSTGFYYVKLLKKYADSTSLVPQATYSVNGTTYYGRQGNLTSIPLTYSIYYDIPIYSSYDAWAKVAAITSQYTITGRIVGNVSGTKDLTDSITVTDDSATKKVQTAIESATVDGVTLTDEQLDEIAAKVIQGLSDTATDDTTDETIDLTDTNSLINNVYISIKTLTDTLTQFKQRYISGSEALQENVGDLADQFEVIEGGGDSGNNNDEDPKIWVPPGFFAVSFLKPLMEYFGNPLSEITKFLDKIMDSVSSLPQLFDKAGELYLGNIFTSLSSIVSYVGQIQKAVDGLPKAIGDVIEIPEINPQEIVEAFNNELVWPDINVEIPTINIPEIKIPEIQIPEIELPEINFPSIPNYLDILNDILTAIKNMFVIDTVAIGESANGLKDIWDDHLPFIPKLQAILSTFQFDNTYDYPVIKIQTPTILTSFYDKNYIVLLDFKDYSYYFLWARRIVRAMLWVGFAYSIFKHFRVRFHIG